MKHVAIRSGLNLDVLKAIDAPYTKDVLLNYLMAVCCNRPITMGGIRISYLAFFLLLISCAKYFYSKETNKEVRILYLVSSSLIVIYLVMHLWTYVGGMFSQGESVTLSSFERYLFYITISCTFVVIYLILSYYKNNLNLLLLITSILLAMACGQIMKPKEDIKAVKEKIIKEQKRITRLANFMKSNNGKLCLIDGIEGSSYGYNLMLNYYLAPRAAVCRYPRYEHRFIGYTDNCTYLFITEPDDTFMKEYGKYFVGTKIVDMSMYSVHAYEGKITLQFIENYE